MAEKKLISEFLPNLTTGELASAKESLEVAALLPMDEARAYVVGETFRWTDSGDYRTDVDAAIGEDPTSNPEKFSNIINSTNVAEALASIDIYDHIYINAGAMIPRTTNGAEAVTTELPTFDKMIDTLEFDAGTEEAVGFWVVFPPDWDTAIDVKARFIATTIAGASGGFTFGIIARSYQHSSAMDGSLGTHVIVNTTWVGDKDYHRSALSGAITIDGAGQGEGVYFEIIRDVADGNDDMAADVGLMGVELEFGRTLATSTTL